MNSKDSSCVKDLWWRRMIKNVIRKLRMFRNPPMDRRVLDPIIANMHDALIVIDSHEAIVAVNRSALNLLGYHEDELIGQSAAKIFSEGFSSNGRGLDPLIEAGSEGYVETVYRSKEGKSIPVMFSVSKILNHVGMILTAKDISERKRLEEVHQLTQFSIDRAADAAFWIGPDARIYYVNEAACRILGYSKEELLALTVHDIDPNLPRSSWKEHWEEVKGARSFTIESNHRTKGGRVIPVEMAINYIKFKEKEYNCAFVRDISERKRTEESLSYLAHHDGLTHLPNRTLLLDRLDQALVRAHRYKKTVAVLFIDLDHFKAINDSLGHSVGDLLLRTVAERLSQSVRKEDTVARLGGDEFAVIFSDVTQSRDVAKIIKKFPKIFEMPFQLMEHEFYITASIGVSLYPNDGDKAEILLRDADTAMYRAKEKGRNNYQFFLPEMNVEVSERLELESGLRRALDRNELLLHYQPQVDLITGQIIGMEALLRWRHPDRGMIPPGQFIPVAEDTGLIVPIGEWVLQTACMQNKAWQSVGIDPIRMAVNLSARQFQHPNLVGTVSRALRDSGLDPDYLELELTESIMETAEAAIMVLRELSQMGIEISLDDFGTGYSSLSYLKRFPINKLKIDQSFVRDLTTDSEVVAIVATIITLARSLRLKVIAEGVEKDEELSILRSLDCDEIQGYLFCPPLPAEEATALLIEKRRLGRKEKGSKV